jgi:hypothetical protein
MLAYFWRRIARAWRVVTWRLQPAPMFLPPKVLPFTCLLLFALFTMPTPIVKVCARGCGIERTWAAERVTREPHTWRFLPPWFAAMADPLPQPQLIQHIAGSNTLGSGVLPVAPSVASIKLQLKNVSLAGNLIIVSTLYDDGAGTLTASVADNLGHTYVAGAVKVRDATQQSSASMWHVPNCFAGVDTITVTYSAASSFCCVHVSEFTNIALTSAKDVSTGTTVASTPYSSGSMTTTVANDLVYVVGFGTSAIPSSIASYTPGAQGSGFRLLHADSEDDSIAQYQVFQTTGAIDSGFTQNPGTQRHIILACSFKPAFAGSPAPAGPRVVRMNHNNLWNDNGTSTYTFQMPCNGDLLVMGGCFIQAAPLGNVSVSSITDSNGNSWAKADAIELASAAAGRVEMWYAADATTSDDLVITLNLSGTQSQSDLMFYDCINMETVGRVLGSTGTASGFQNVNANLTTVTLTPQRAGGICFNATGVNDHTISGCANANFLFDAMVYPAADAQRGFDEDNGKCHIFHTDTSPLTFIYTCQNNVGGVKDWTSVSAEFFARTSTYYRAGGVMRKRVVT